VAYNVDILKRKGIQSLLSKPEQQELLGRMRGIM
jgi:hypothetical protein